MSDSITTAKLKTALQKAFPLPEYATFFEVGDATGGHQSRWADAVSMACWPSRGLLIWGFEIKASRADWLREKKDPKKSCAVQRYCDRWVLVTAPGVIAEGELPATWGHMELQGAKLVHVVKAPALTPEPLHASFVAALLRRCGEVSEVMMQERMSAQLREAHEKMEERVQAEAQRRATRNSKALEAVERFKEQTGIDLCDWEETDAGEGLAAFRKVRQSLKWTNYAAIGEELQKTGQSITALHAALLELDLMPAESASTFKAKARKA